MLHYMCISLQVMVVSEYQHSLAHELLYAQVNLKIDSPD